MHINKSTRASQRAQKVLQESTYDDRSRYRVGVPWSDDQINLPNNYFSALVELKSLEHRLGMDPKLTEHYSTTNRDDFSKSLIIEDEMSICFKTDQLREWYLSHNPFFHPHKRGKVRRVPSGAAKCQGLSLNSALPTGLDLLHNLIHVYSVSASTRLQFLLTSFSSGSHFEKTNPLSVFSGGTRKLQCFSTLITFWDQRLRHCVLTTLLTELSQTTRVSFQKPQEVSTTSFRWMTF